MKLFVKAKPGVKTERVERVDDSHFIVAVRERASEGRANEAVLKALAKFLGIAPSRFRVAAGRKSKAKTVEVE
ncbi:MAG: DUF167 domain-containing protein [Candidatus Wildermuthbacteria bacterium]|nr:DUF167 domain-containing protein [Candidatus Wildermuthbacteria bacterium]